MSVTPSPLIGSDSNASANDLWAPKVLYLHDWSLPISETITWRTVVLSALSLAEQRISQADKPYRIQQLVFRSYDRLGAQQIIANVRRSMRARSITPLQADRAELRGRTSPLGNRYFVNREFRRFQVGARVVAFAETPSAGMVEGFTFRKVLSLPATDQIELDGDLGETYSPPTIASHTSVAAVSNTLTVIGGTFILAAGQSICGFLASVGVLPGSISSVVLKCLDTGFEIDLVAAGVLISQSKTVGGETLRVGAIAAYPIQDPRLWGQCSITWTIAGGSSSRHNVHSLLVNGVHRTVGVFANGFDLTAGSGVINDLVVTPSMPQGSIISLHTGVSATGQFVSGTETYITESHQANLQTFVQYLQGGTVGAPDTLSASHNGSPSLASLTAFYFELAPVEQGGFSLGGVMPVMESELALTGQVQGRTDTVFEVPHEAIESAGVSALDPTISPGLIPAWCYSSGGYPILSTEHDWKTVMVNSPTRGGERVQTGIGSIVQAFGSLPGDAYTLSLLATTREDCFRLLEFFDSRAGRAHPFWLPAPAPYLTATTAAGTSVVVAKAITSQDWESHKNLAVRVLATGVWSRHAITSVVVGVSDVTLTVTPALPAGGPSGLDIRFCYLLRFSSDELEVSWITNDKLTCSLGCEELVNEQVVAIELEDNTGAGGGSAWEPDDAFDLCKCAEKICGVTDPGGCCICGMDGLTYRLAHYLGSCHPLVDDCAEPAVLKKKCAGVLPFLSCVNNIARWQLGDFWVELDTETKVWSYDAGTNLCALGFDNGSGACFCSISPFCWGQPDTIEEWDCKMYTKKRLRNQYQPLTPCDYVEITHFELLDGGPGSARCAV